MRTKALSITLSSVMALHFALVEGQLASQMSAVYPRLPLTYAPIKEQHLSKLKLLNSVIFPINYQVGALQDVGERMYGL